MRMLEVQSVMQKVVQRAMSHSQSMLIHYHKMDGACNICKLKTAEFQHVDDSNKVATFWQWATAKEEKVNKKGEKVVTKVTKKENQSCFVKDLTAKCSEMLSKFKKHTCVTFPRCGMVLHGVLIFGEIIFHGVLA